MSDRARERHFQGSGKSHDTIQTSLGSMKAKSRLEYDENISRQEKRCALCGEVKSFSEYPIDNGRRDQRHVYCKSCYSNRQRMIRLRDFFLLSVEDADKVFAYQGNLCAICKRPPAGGKRLALDHRHKDGLLRGALCNLCNRAIARFYDDPVRLKRAADYLENPPAVKALGREHFARPGQIGTKKQRAAIKRERKAKEKA